MKTPSGGSVAEADLSAPAIRAAIAWSGMLKCDVAVRAGIRPGQLSVYLRERAPLPPDVARRILDAIPGRRGANGG
jgi:hypothetical protein